MSTATSSKNLLKACLVFGAVIAFAASCIDQSAKIPVPLTASETPEPLPQKASARTFEAFSHTIPEHKEFECNSCHQREGRSLDMEFAAHDSCVGCHLNQFTDRSLMDKDKVMCSICHGDLQANPPPMKTFPVKFREGFNMKFDHSAHDNGEGRPPAGCASCHQSAGPGKTIPVGFQAHNNCFTCHTAESKIGSCSTCHEIAPYRRTSPGRTAFRGSFSHGDHNGVGCADCHTIRAGAPQGKQATNIAVSQHCGGTNNCATCHNGVRSFGDGNFANLASCARCHAGAGFDMLAGDPCRK